MNFQRYRTLSFYVFLAVFGTAAGVVTLMSVATDVSVGRNFARYVTSLELAGFDSVLNKVVLGWRETGDLVAIPVEEQAFRRWTFDALNRSEAATDRRAPPRDGPPGPGVRRGGGEDGPPPRGSRGAPLPPDRFQVARRFAVFDAAGQQIRGVQASASDFVLREVRVDGELVAYLGLLGEGVPTEAAAQGFLAQQKSIVIWISVIALFVSAGVAYSLARRLKKSTDRLVAGTQAMSDGRFATRLETSHRDELDAVAEHFNIMAGRLEQQESARREWLSNTSHELRTPLTALRALVEALQEGVRQPDGANLGLVHQQIMLLDRLVNDLYQLEQQDSGSLKLDARLMAPMAVLADVVDSQGERFQKAGIIVSVDDQTPGAVMCADARRIRQVILNVLENSLRYTDAPGRLCIHSEWGVGDEKGLWLCYFDDSAPGVAGGDLQRIFERFYRVDASRSRAQGGSGLGLAICRAIVEAHGGQMMAAVSPHGGLRIVLSLPRGGVANRH